MAQELLRLDHVTRRITSEFYIRGITLTVNKGEVLALAGKNAAGKSTLTGVINGNLAADSGRIFFEGAEVTLSDPAVALGHGIVTLAQNNQGFDNLPVCDNVLLANPKYFKTGGLSHKKLGAVCADAFAKLGIDVDPQQAFCSLTPAQKQSVAIARAYLCDAKLIIMDEPSSRLPQKECGILYGAVRALKEAGVAIIYITHRLDEILLLADKVALVERGEVKEVRSTQGLTELDLIEAIEGFQVNDIYSKEEVAQGEVLLSVQNFAAEQAHDISFELHQGEIIAFLSDSGVCGRTIYRMLCGLEDYTGTVCIAGKPVRLNHPLVTDEQRIVTAIDEETEEMMKSFNAKKGTGFLSRMIGEVLNTTRGVGKTMGGMVGMHKADEYMTGGFRQKELMMRTLCKDGDIYVLVDPTNGIDLQTRMKLYVDIGGLAKRGRGVLFFTNDVCEALGLADYIVVLDTDTVVFQTNAKKTTAATLTKLLKG